METDWRGRELRRGGESFGADATYALSRLFPLGVIALGVLGRRDENWFVGVFALVVGIPVEVLPCGRRKVVGELDRVDGGLVEGAGLLSLRAETGNLEEADNCVASLDAWFTRGVFGRGVVDFPARSLCARL